MTEPKAFATSKVSPAIVWVWGTGLNAEAVISAKKPSDDAERTPLDALVSHLYLDEWEPVQGSEDILKYDPNQPRDEAGRWTATGSGGSAAEWAARFDDPNADLDSVLAQFEDEDIRERMIAMRSKLDGEPSTAELYSADGMWDEDRVRDVHDPIIQKFLTKDVIEAAQAAPGERPEYITLGGRPASGKSFFTIPKASGGRGLNDAGNYFVFHSDRVLQSLPGYQGWNAALYHEEAKAIANKIIDVARAKRLNLVVEGTMRNARKVQRNAQIFKDAGYDVSGFYMHLPRQESARRTVSRFLTENRYVPVRAVLENKHNERVFDDMRSQYKRWEVYDNQVPFGEPPRLVGRSG